MQKCPHRNQTETVSATEKKGAKWIICVQYSFIETMLLALVLQHIVDFLLFPGYLDTTHTQTQTKHVGVMLRFNVFVAIELNAKPMISIK